MNTHRDLSKLGDVEAEVLMQHRANSGTAHSGAMFLGPAGASPDGPVPDRKE